MPITYAAACSVGTAPPTSTTARWMQRTMTPVESYRVPSQSKAIRSNWRGRGLGMVVGKLLEVGGQRRFEAHRLVGGGMAEL